ncbi:MAG: hypothetical protein NUV64_01280 [Parcubacteria group bacterium]|nr:hypothetical protein [Parcubacteria group bacterium]
MGNVLLFKKREEQEQEKRKREDVLDDFDPLFPGEEEVDGRVVIFIGNC